MSDAATRDRDQQFDKKADFLLCIGNAKRLQVLQIIYDSEVAVAELADMVGLSQSALSQHLAKLRSARLVKARRDAQTIFYSCASPAVLAILELLKQMFDDEAPNGSE